MEFPLLKTPATVSGVQAKDNRISAGRGWAEETG
jgi:hypothetical protein